MQNDPATTLHTTRTLPATPARVYGALADPTQLATWWGPAGFRNEFESFDFRPGGGWTFVMIDPSGGRWHTAGMDAGLRRPRRGRRRAAHRRAGQRAEPESAGGAAWPLNLVRVDRLIHGNPGDHRNLTDGVSELKIDVGPGYRVYYMQRGTVLLLLLAGGDKSTQPKDITKAIALAQGYEE